MINDLAKKLLQAIKQVDKTTTGYDTAATVKRIEGDTAWVHIPGGVDETPVKLTIDAKEGDNVQVRVNGGRAWLQGNATAPPTDDTTAISAEKLAESARQAADTASNSAQRAVEDAGRAYAAANNAEQSATAASQAAATADAKAVAAGNAASAAATAAATADSKAEAASQSASAAASAASAASTAAATADAKAEAAGQAATTANNAANNALTQLATVEDVVDVLNWITEHGTYKASQDTEVVAGKYYFTRTGSGTTADPYVYTVVTNPTGNPSTQNYYELDSVDEAVTNYISTHLALTDDGLYLIKDGSGYKLRLTNNGMYIVAPNATVVNQTTADGNIIRSTDGTIIAHLGYGEGTSSSGTIVSPYYTLGDRRTTSTPYDQTRTYKVGDLCVYNGKNYICTNDIDTPQAWNSNNWNYTIGSMSFATGYQAIASGAYSHAEGIRPKAMGPWSHAEGGGSDPGDEGTMAGGSGSHSEGIGTKALETACHAEGYHTTASGRYSHAEGNNSTASGENSHAEGYHTTASGRYSHAEGWYTTASGLYSHASGQGTTADRPYQTAIGQYNTTGNVHNLFVVGNGNGADTTDPTVANRSDAFTVDSSGNTYAAGDMNLASGKQYKINGTALAASDVGAVPTTRTVNSKALSSDITLTASDVSAVPTTRKVNNKALSSDITLTASDVGALPTSTTYVSGVKGNSESTYRTGNVNITAANVGAVPTTRTVNSKALSSDISLTASDVGAVPTSRTVNSKALSSNITLAPSDLGINDYVIAQSQSSTSYGDGVWRWREWNSGKVEIWYHGYLTLTSADSDRYGVKRYSRWFNFPNSYSLYRCSAIVNGMNDGGWYGCGGLQNASSQVAEPFRKFQVMSYRISTAPPAQADNLNIYICGQKSI